MFTKDNVRKGLLERNNPNINYTELFYLQTMVNIVFDKTLWITSF